MKTLFESLESLLNSKENIESLYPGKLGVISGLRDLDQYLGGFRSGCLYTLASRPAMGKTTCLLSFAYNAAYAYKLSQQQEGAKTLYFSPSMPTYKIIRYLLSQACAIPYSALDTARMSNDEMERLIVASSELSDFPLIIDDTPALSIDYLAKSLEKAIENRGVNFVIIDGIHQMTISPEYSGSRAEEVSKIVRKIKALAMKHNIPIIMSANMPRGWSFLSQTHDVRESGSIEEESDVIMLIDREYHHLDRNVNTACARFRAIDSQRLVLTSLQVARQLSKNETILPQTSADGFEPVRDSIEKYVRERQHTLAKAAQLFTISWL